MAVTVKPGDHLTDRELALFIFLDHNCRSCQNRGWYWGCRLNLKPRVDALAEIIDNKPVHRVSCPQFKLWEYWGRLKQKGV
jgi:hypothetical protein